MPAGVHDPKVVSLEDEGEARKKRKDSLALVWRREPAVEGLGPCPWRTLGLVVVRGVPPGPTVALFAVPQEQVDLVVARDTESLSTVGQPTHKLHHG